MEVDGTPAKDAETDENDPNADMEAGQAHIEEFAGGEPDASSIIRRGKSPIDGKRRKSSRIRDLMAADKKKSVAENLVTPSKRSRKGNPIDTMSSPISMHIQDVRHRLGD